MKSSGVEDNSSHFNRYVLYSFLLHLGVGFLAWLVFRHHEIPLPPETRITWLQFGGPMGQEEGLPFKETKTLPQTTIEEQKKASFEQPPPPKETLPPAKKEEKKPEGAEKEKVTVEDKTKKEKKTPPPKELSEKKPEGKPVQDKRINDALAKINEDLKERTPIPEAAQVKEGGEGSPHGNPGGSNTECIQYSARVKQRIVGNWARLIGGSRPPRPPKVFLTINSGGGITSSQFIQKSGDVSLDASAMRAVQNSSPLPSPPVNCEMALRSGITVQFGR